MTKTITAVTWGVKQSFRAYVEGSSGSIETAAPAARGDDGLFTFPVDSSAGAPGLTLDPTGHLAGSAALAGEITFRAHGGMLNVRVGDLMLEVRPEGAVISTADRAGRLDLAELNLAAATREPDGALLVPATMAKDGWLILGDHYPWKTPIDPVRLNVS